MLRDNQKKITIGLVLSSVPGYSETFFRNKIKGLQEHGFEVILFVDKINKLAKTITPCTVISAIDFNGGFLKKVKNIIYVIIKAVFVCPRKSFLLYKLDKKDGVSFKSRLRNIVLNQFLLSKDLDWLHFGFGMLAVNRENVAKAIDSKMAVSFRGFDLYLSPLKHINCYDSLFLKDVKYHVLAEEMKDTLIDYKVANDKIHVITPAIDITFFKKIKEVAENRTVKLLTIARLHWKKGLEYTLQALSELKRLGVEYEYTIVGDGIEFERLVFATHQLGIADNVFFVGKQSPEEVKNHLNNSNIYLQYSIQEGFCNAVLEAQSMGLLCIVSNAEGLSENVLHKKTGWVVPKRRPDLLCQKIEEIINMSDEEKQLIRKQAITRVQNDFNLDKQNALFLEFYKN